MALSIDGTPVNIAGQSGASFTIGPITTTFTNGEVFIVVLTNLNGGGVSSISGGSLTFTRRAFTSQGGTNIDNIEEWSAPVGGSVVNNVTFTVTLSGSASYISASLFAVSNGGSSISFDAGGPQTSTSGLASMTTSETALIIPSARFSATGAPTASSPWTGICSGVSGAFLGVEYQVAAASRRRPTPRTRSRQPVTTIPGARRAARSRCPPGSTPPRSPP